MTNSERHQMTVPNQVPSKRPDPTGPVADEPVLGVLTGQYPARTMPIAGGKDASGKIVGFPPAEDEDPDEQEDPRA